jgi:hypothetical protein
MTKVMTDGSTGGILTLTATTSRADTLAAAALHPSLR